MGQWEPHKPDCSAQRITSPISAFAVCKLVKFLRDRRPTARSRILNVVCTREVQESHNIPLWNEIFSLRKAVILTIT